MPQSMSLRKLKLEDAAPQPAPKPPIRNQQEAKPAQKSLSSLAQKPEKGNKTNPTPGGFNDELLTPPVTDQGGQPQSQSEQLSSLASIVAIAACWCAALYYPLGSRDWWACRNWILMGWTSPVGKGFAYFYKRYGLRWSEYLTAHPKLMEAVKPFFVWANRRGKDM